MADVRVRPARAADAERIALVQSQTWRQAYAELLPPEVLELPLERLAETWRTAAASPPSSRHRLLVALDGEELVGLALSAPDEELPAFELASLLVLPRWGRRGHGSRLLAACVQAWREDGAELAVCWLLERDRASAGFLRGAGWEPDGGARGLETGHGTLRQVRFHADLREG
ncbi:MAG: GNAT family N-acetyltransferase [Actinomycetota bacterium]|jgi:GNAT superfamily N-acetyltransferase|nr:GNAT family N-acetyltransferase [Actinomycetota bacterium]